MMSHNTENIMRADPHVILGVPRDATGKDIANAYRQLALALHPDKSETAEAVARFEEVQWAYEVLKNRDNNLRHIFSDSVFLEDCEKFSEEEFAFVCRCGEVVMVEGHARTVECSNCSLGFEVRRRAEEKLDPNDPSSEEGPDESEDGTPAGRL